MTYSNMAANGVFMIVRGSLVSQYDWLMVACVSLLGVLLTVVLVKSILKHLTAVDTVD